LGSRGRKESRDIARDEKRNKKNVLSYPRWPGKGLGGASNELEYENAPRGCRDGSWAKLAVQFAGSAGTIYIRKKFVAPWRKP